MPIIGHPAYLEESDPYYDAKISTLMRIADYLGVPLDYLYEDDDEPGQNP